MEPQDFIREHGWHVRGEVLAFLLKIPCADVEQARALASPQRRAKPLDYAALFNAWHGRSPADDEWPAPYEIRPGCHVWLQPELKLLASMVGTLGYAEIAEVLTRRLQLLTGDETASREKNAVVLAANRMGLVATDVLGGITVTEAGREIGATSIVHKAIEGGRLKARKVGRLWVIPHGEWTRWKATLVKPPKGYVPLAGLRERLGIRSDSKLPEFASMGYIPSAIRCNPYGAGIKTTKHGSWYIKASVAKKLLADRKAGRPMPWHGKPLPVNLAVTWRRWQKVKHPRSCATCQEIWGPKGAPATLDDYMARYPALQHGQKRHLTMMWRPGLRVAQLAVESGYSQSYVKRAINNGMMKTTLSGRTAYVSRTEATRWRARGCPTGEGRKSFISLERAMDEYGFSPAELRSEILSGRLKGKVETSGPNKGRAFVVRQQCALYRQRVGFTEAQAAARVGVSVAHLLVLLRGVDWRVVQGGRIPLDTVQAAIKRHKSSSGLTIPEAAKLVGKSEAWVRQQIAAGFVHVKQVKWDRRRVYLTAPMLQRLKDALKNKSAPRSTPDKAWLPSGPAATEAGVTPVTLGRWAEEGSLKRKRVGRYWNYHREAVRSRATVYWDGRLKRGRRANVPDWYRNSGQVE